MYPVLVGEGKPAFPGDDRAQLELLEEHRFDKRCRVSPLPHTELTLQAEAHRRFVSTIQTGARVGPQTRRPVVARGASRFPLSKNA